MVWRVRFPVWAALILSAGVSPAFANDPAIVSVAQQATVWDAEVRQKAAGLFERTSSGDQAHVLAALEAARSDPALSPARRDAVIHVFGQSLRRLPPADLPDSVLDWLAAYRPQALRLHDESASATVPLFDIAALAAGLRNEKRHQSGRASLLSVEGDDWSVWLDRFASADDAIWRRGVAAAVPELSPARLTTLAAALERDGSDTMRDLAIAVWLAGQDHVALQGALRRSTAQEATDILRAGIAVLPSGDAFALCIAALDHGDPGVRGVAIAHASRIAADDPAVRESWRHRLRDLLVDDDAGVAAALALARLPDDALVDLKASAQGDERLLRRLELVERLRAGLVGIDDAKAPRP